MQLACSPSERCERMARLVEERCVARFGRAPRTVLHADPRGRTFPFAPEHMDLVLRELLVESGLLVAAWGHRSLPRLHAS